MGGNTTFPRARGRLVVPLEDDQQHVVHHEFLHIKTRVRGLAHRVVVNHPHFDCPLVLKHIRSGTEARTFRYLTKQAIGLER